MLSVKATKALEQVKLGLSTLYGADYFSEDDWIKIDYIVHKGRYVFTNGPCNSTILLDQPLMTFDDDDVKPTPNPASNMHTNTRLNNDLKTADLLTSQEPVSSEPSDSIGETTSAESMSDVPDSSALPSAQSNPASKYPTVTAKATLQPPNKSPSAGLPNGYTQQQLDEIKAFNASLTKAGQKGRPNYSKTDYASSAWTEEPSDNFQPSPRPAEREARITSWADEVQYTTESAAAQSNSAPVSREEVVKQLVSIHGRSNDYGQQRISESTPKRAASVSSSMTAKTTKSKSKANSQPPVGNANEVVKGRTYLAKQNFESKSMIQLDVQNGDHINVSKHVSGVFWTGTNQRTGKSGQFPETVLRPAAQAATNAAPSATNQAMSKEQQAIKTNAENSTAVMNAWTEQATIRQTDGADDEPDFSQSRPDLDLDDFESYNANEWDEVPVRPRSTAPKSIFQPSAFAAPPALQSQDSRPSQQLVLASKPKTTQTFQMTKEMDEEFAKIVSDKVCPTKISFKLPSSKVSSQSSSSKTSFSKSSSSKNSSSKNLSSKSSSSKTFSQNSSSKTSSRRRNSRKQVDQVLARLAPASSGSNKTNQPVKTEVCWFWKTGKGCRFTADECMNLHMHLPGASDQTLRRGKPMWGSVLDYLPSPSETSETKITPSLALSSFAPSATLNSNAKTMTCWYWAQGSCQNAAEDCKFRHDNEGSGVANRPYTVPKPKPTAAMEVASWRPIAPESGLPLGEVAWGANIMDQSNDWDAPATEHSWDTPTAVTTSGGTWGDNSAKPSHIQDMEARALAEVVGW